MVSQSWDGHFFGSKASQSGQWHLWPSNQRNCLDWCLTGWRFTSSKSCMDWIGTNMNEIWILYFTSTFILIFSYSWLCLVLHNVSYSFTFSCETRSYAVQGSPKVSHLLLQSFRNICGGILLPWPRMDFGFPVFGDVKKGWHLKDR